MLLHLPQQEGIEEERCRLDYVSADEGDKFVQVVTEMTETIRKMGPLRRHFNSQPNGDS
jgi:F420-non-reducing hydrogenase iron-sulfur subunit